MKEKKRAKTAEKIASFIVNCIIADFHMTSSKSEYSNKFSLRKSSRFMQWAWISKLLRDAAFLAAKRAEVEKVTYMEGFCRVNSCHMRQSMT